MGKQNVPKRPHDRSRRLLFHHPRSVRDLVRGFVRDPWVDELDFETLKRVPSDHLSAMLPGEFEERSSDVIWKVRWKDRKKDKGRKKGKKASRELYLLILVELQSTCEQAMILRILGYVVMLYLRLVKERPLKKGERLPPVLPLVMYNGKPVWWAPLRFQDLVDEVPESFQCYVPAMECCLIDEERVPAERLRALVENVAALIVRTQQSAEPESFRSVVEDVRRWLDEAEDRELIRDLLGWFSKVVIPLNFPGIGPEDLRNVHDLTNFAETTMTNFIAQAEAKGEVRGEVRGEARGRQKGLAGAALRLLGRRFGEVPEDVRARVLAATVDQLDLWIDRVLTADSIEDVFEEAQPS